MVISGSAHLMPTLFFIPSLTFSGDIIRDDHQPTSDCGEHVPDQPGHGRHLGPHLLCTVFHLAGQLFFVAYISPLRKDDILPIVYVPGCDKHLDIWHSYVQNCGFLSGRENGNVW